MNSIDTPAQIPDNGGRRTRGNLASHARMEFHLSLTPMDLMPHINLSWLHLHYSNERHKCIIAVFKLLVDRKMNLVLKIFKR